MSATELKQHACALLLLLLTANTAEAITLSVNCGGKAGLTTINAAVRALQGFDYRGPGTINVSGACHENVAIQSIDRLTLNAVNGASVSDASGGTLDVISVADSRDVAINGFTVNGVSTGSANGISCNDYSICRLSGNVIQGAGNGGFAVYGASNATLDGDTLQNNLGAGLVIRTGSTVRLGLRPFTARRNGQGINMGRGSIAAIGAVIESNSDQGVVVQEQSTLDFSGSSSSNGSHGANVREGSVARFTSATISNNGGEGVLVSDLSIVSFSGATVTGNVGGTDVFCAPQFSATRGTATDIGGGTTNCVEH
jgi:hypothetical protein